MKSIVAAFMYPLMVVGFVAAVVCFGLWAGWHSAFKDFPKWLNTK